MYQSVTGAELGGAASTLKASLVLQYVCDKWEKQSEKVGGSSMRSAKSDEHMSAMFYAEVS